jgi:hypothetical protein
MISTGFWLLFPWYTLLNNDVAPGTKSIFLMGEERGGREEKEEEKGRKGIKKGRKRSAPLPARRMNGSGWMSGRVSLRPW